MLMQLCESWLFYLLSLRLSLMVFARLLVPLFVLLFWALDLFAHGYSGEIYETGGGRDCKE